MQVLASHIKNLPVVSLQSGDHVAHVLDAVVNPANLAVLGFRCLMPHQRATLVLLMRDLRQYTADYLIIETDDDLADPADIVRLTAVIGAHFQPAGKPVVSDLGRHLGQVDDYSINLPHHCVQKLYVRPAGLRSWFGPDLTIDRSQIVDVTPRHIVVRDSSLPEPLMPTEAIPDSPA